MLDAWKQRRLANYIPYQGHIAPGVVLLDDGSLLVMARIRGVPHELAAVVQRNAAARVLNAIWRSTANSRITLYTHLVRYPVNYERPDPVFSSDFATCLYRTYCDRVLHGQLYTNEWFLSAVVTPEVVPVGTQQFRADLRKLLERFRSRDESDIDISQAEEVSASLTQSLEAYSFERLGLRHNGRAWFSEIAEALALILTTRPRSVPMISRRGRLSHAVYTDQAVFDARTHRILAPGQTTWGAMFRFTEYMAETYPGMLDQLLSLPMPLVLTQSFAFTSRSAGQFELTHKRDQMRAVGDEAADQLEQLAEAKSETAIGGKVRRGTHQISLAVYGSSERVLENGLSLAEHALRDSGATVALETLGNQGAYFSQLPGMKKWRTYPASISTRNFADLCTFGAFPGGDATGKWGAAPITFKTTAGTAYDFTPHVDGDVAMMAVFGRITSGKTTLLMMLIAMLDQSIGDDGLIFFFDKDQGGELLVRAVDGAYLVVRSGEPSGLAPLLGLKNTYADREFLVRWIKGLILLDSGGPIASDDDRKLAVAVSAILRKPARLRSILALRQYLGGWNDPASAGERLTRWCRGNALGWAFDGERDEVDVSARLVGFDLTAVLGQAEIVGPVAAYLFYRIEQLMDGRRIAGLLDEAHAFMKHPMMRTRFEDGILTGRKKNVMIGICTQEPKHLLDGGAFGATIVSQCRTKIVFHDPSASRETYVDDMRFTEGEFWAITEGILPGSRQFLIKRDSGSAIVDFDLSAMPEWVAVLSGRSKTVRFGERLRAEHGSGWVAEFQKRYATEAVD